MMIDDEAIDVLRELHPVDSGSSVRLLIDRIDDLKVETGERDAFRIAWSHLYGMMLEAGDTAVGSVMEFLTDKYSLTLDEDVVEIQRLSYRNEHQRILDAVSDL